MMKQFFELLKGGLWADYTPDEKLFDSNTDWREIFDIAKRQTVICVVWDGVEKLPQTLRPSRELYIKIYSYVTRTAQTNNIINAKVAELFQLFESHSLKPIIMKGASVAALYPNPLRRSCGDIDIYFGKEDIELANEVLRAKYKEVIDEEDVSESAQHTHFVVDGITVENHRLMNTFYSKSEEHRFNRELNSWYPDGAKKIEIGGVITSTLPDKFNTQYLYLHTMRHFLIGGVGLRQLCDLAIVMSKSKLTESDIIVTKSTWQVIERLLVLHLGLAPKHTVYNRSDKDHKVDRVIEFVLRDGNFGHEAIAEQLGKRPKGYFAGKWYSFKWQNRRRISLLSIFPYTTIASSTHSTYLSITQIFKDKFTQS